jgi:DNA uptake protein ComE-like DNA-binding protein
MNDHMGKTCLITLALFFAAGMVHANTQQAGTTGQPAASSQAATAENKGKGSKTINAVDINSASKAELKTLPSIDGVRADKIIAGRPYPSKAFLVTRNIIPLGIYEQIRRQIVAMPK